MSRNTVLIVEDEAIVATDLANKLGRLGFEVFGIAAMSEEAIEMVRRLRPQLVLMDIQLNGPLDGIQAAVEIRSRYDVPVIYLTAHSDAATLARAKLTGPLGYILKPIDERDLATQIEMGLYKHRADREVREQRELLRVTLNSIGDAVVATDFEGRISFINPVAESLTGWQAEDALGQPVTEVFRIVNEQTGEPLEAPVARVLREGKAVVLANHAAVITRDGRSVPIEDCAAPILDGLGEVIGAVLVFHDVTEKRRAEEALRETNRELNEYSYALTHNLKAPFRAVQNYTGFLTEDLADTLEGETKLYLEGIKKAVDQANRQFRDLESLYRIRNYAVDFETFEMAELLDEMQSTFVNASGRRLIAGENWPVFGCCRFLLRQILYELISNAFKYNRSDMKTVETGWQKVSDDRFEIWVRDNGIGIDPRYHDHIFQIFKRLHTEREFEGNGIGLAIVKRAAQNMNGNLRVESAVGKGSTFYLTLPNSAGIGPGVVIEITG